MSPGSMAVQRKCKAAQAPDEECEAFAPAAAARSARAAKAQRPEFLSPWSGQGVRLARRRSAAALMDRLAHETDAAIARLARSE